MEAGGQAKKTCFTYELTNDQQELLLGVMLTGNYRRREVPYSLWSVEGEGFNATLYEKEKHGRRKLCVQGSRAEDFVLFVLEPRVLGAASFGYEKELRPEDFAAHAGSDESGKGDYFGPLVVCCAHVTEEQGERLRAMGVRDCKEMTDKAILAAGEQMRRYLGTGSFSLVRIGPAAYNRLYAKIGNINRLLAWAHGAAIEEVLEKQPGCKRVVVDQFAPTEATIKRALKPLGRKAQVVQRHKAESDIAVAAASVLAREAFLRAVMADEDLRIADPSHPEKLYFPLGSSDPRVRSHAENMVRRDGPKWIMNHCKAHFQTTDKVLAATGFSRADLPPEGQVVSIQMSGKFTRKPNNKDESK
ncbi:MAG: ribonuclease HIII [Kiritimatiellae bacterium]|nr:ribonuclease HIII [Kiritimatiellia bacterium]